MAPMVARCLALRLLSAFALLGAAALAQTPAATPPSDDRLPIPGLEQLRSGAFEGVLHGTGPLWGRDEHDAYLEALADTPPLILRLGINLTPPRHSYEAMLAVLRDDLRAYADEIPLVTIQFHLKRGDRPTIGYDGQVAAGDHDERIAALADTLVEHGGPVFVRVGAEVNGPWNGYTPEHFPAAYRRIVKLFRERGDSFIFVWNCKMITRPQFRYRDFYPGDDVVDWWSLDLFGEDFTDPAVRKRGTLFLGDARRHGKPVMIPECAPSELDIDERYTWQHWFAPFFELLENDLNVKAFCYSNRDFARRDVTLTHWGDMRIDRSENLERYRNHLKRRIFIHGPAPVPEGVLPPESDRPRLRLKRLQDIAAKQRPDGDETGPQAGGPADRPRAEDVGEPGDG